MDTTSNVSMTNTVVAIGVNKKVANMAPNLETCIRVSELDSLQNAGLLIVSSYPVLPFFLINKAFTKLYDKKAIFYFIYIIY